MKTFVWALTAVAVLAVIAYIAVLISPFGDTAQNSGEEPIFCTADAMQCPDGSWVGRSGPNCEFMCPEPEKSATLKTRIDQGASALEVKIIPLALLEDSRCPIDAQCVQAGTVRVRAQVVSGLGTSVNEFTLGGEAITTEAEEIVLTAVEPAPRAGVPIAPSEYLFTFTVTKRSN